MCVTDARNVRTAYIAKGHHRWMLIVWRHITDSAVQISSLFSFRYKNKCVFEKVKRLLFSLELIWFRSLSSCVLHVSFLRVQCLKSSMNWTQQTSIAQCLYNIYFVIFLFFFLHCSLLGCNVSGNSCTESASMKFATDSIEGLICYLQAQDSTVMLG